MNRIKVNTMKEVGSESKEEMDELRGKVLDMFEAGYDQEPQLYAQEHAEFCLYPFKKTLPSSMIKLHAGQTWVLYWCLHALRLLKFDHNKDPTILDSARTWLERIECPDGGFGGGHGQIAHMGVTYGGVSSSIYCTYRPNRVKLMHLAQRMRTEHGLYTMHTDGEIDTRSLYCTIAALHMQGILFEEMFKETTDFLIECQRPDGGFGAEPGSESHAGYTWCALAALAILDKLDCVNTARALEWCCHRQALCEGGCDGRPNKLVDTCYSFYVGASVVICGYAQGIEANLNKEGLEAYVLKACQPRHLEWSEEELRQSTRGGLCDKPGTKADWYHTCYGLSGLSLVRHKGLELTSPLLNVSIAAWRRYRECLEMTAEGGSFGAGDEKFHAWFSPNDVGRR